MTVDADSDVGGRARTRTWAFWTMHDVRVMLIGAGILMACVGGVVLANDIPPRQYPAIVAWMVGALVVHDVLIAGAAFAVVLAGRKAAARAAFLPIVIVQGALSIGAIMALLVIPEIVKKSVGTANPSVLPLDYATNLAIFLLGLALAAGAAILLSVWLARPARARRIRR